MDTDTTAEPSQAYLRVKKTIEDKKTKGLSVFDYLKSLIIPKTYGTFRIYAKAIEDVLQEFETSSSRYNNANDMTAESILHIRELMNEKKLKKGRLVEVNIKFGAFFEEAERQIEYISREKMNILFLVPFLNLKQIKECMNLKFSNITINEMHGDYIMIAHNSITNETFKIYIKKYGEFYSKLFNFAKEKYGENSYLFGYYSDEKTFENTDIHRVYQLLNEDILNVIKPYIIGATDNTNFLTPLKILQESFYKDGYNNSFALL